MEIHAKTMTNRSEVDEIFENAIEWQERARQNHGLTLDIKTCIGYVIKISYTDNMHEIAQSLGVLVELARVTERRKVYATCEVCGTKYELTRSGQKYCGDSCKNKAFRQKQQNKTAEQS